jgi:uncharacterized RDD family membrane protein YckC
MADEILIGEGVALDVRPASFATRTLAIALDLVVLLVGIVLVSGLLSTLTAYADEAVQNAVLVALFALATVGVPTAVETLSRGRSLGKVALGLRIVRDDGGPVRFRHALIRALVGVFELWLTIGSVALITSLVNAKGKRLGDLVAGTYAIRIRGGQQALVPIVMPPELAVWARHADIRRLPDGLALSARQFLGRTSGLHLSSRMRLGVDLAARVETYVAPGPPPGTHPERFLAAVLAERRDREYARAIAVAARTSAETSLVARLPHAIPDPS